MAKINDSTFRRMIRMCGGMEVVTPMGSFRGVFDHEFLDVNDMETRVPVLTCSTADVTNNEIRKGGNLVIGGADYKVRRHEPDGTGMSRLILE